MTLERIAFRTSSIYTSIMNSDESNAALDTATAYHEAGHAVVALALDRPILKVSVLPKHEILGQVRLGKGVTRPSDDWLEREILIALAGMAAEARHTGRYCREGAARDLRYVRKLALQRATERQLDRFERRMMAKVENLLADEGHWQAVEEIAQALLAQGTISGRAARHLYERATA
jgi:ATP-dependent Zn protease